MQTPVSSLELPRVSRRSGQRQQQSMRLVSWNMAYWKRGGFNTLVNRKRQWAFLAALAPDVALLQECRPDDLHDNAPEWAAKEYEVIGSIPARWTACSAVLARRSLSPKPFSYDQLPARERSWFEYFSGYLALASIETDEGPIVVVSVHATAKEVDLSTFTEADHLSVHRPALSSTWNNDLAFAACRRLVEGQVRFVVGGDWNTARLMDQIPAFGPPSVVAFFAHLHGWGWCESLRKTHPDEEVQTYLDPACQPYELDHIFTDKDLHDRLVRCDAVSDDFIRELSDHAPIVADFATG
jgi:exonuclease III